MEWWGIGRFWGRKSHCGCRWSGWRWTSYFSTPSVIEYVIGGYGVNIPAQLVVEQFGVIEHFSHPCYACDVPLGNVNVEQISIIEHGIHVYYTRHVPPGNVNVEDFGFIEHHLHRCYAWDVPSRNIPIKRSCNLEHSVHRCYSRYVPRTKVFIKCATVERWMHWCNEGHVPFLDRPVKVVGNVISPVCGPPLNSPLQRIIRFKCFRCGFGHRWTSYFSSTVWANTEFIGV